MQINKSERDGDAVLLTISTDTDEYEPPVVIRHTPGEGGYSQVGGPSISEEEDREVEGILDDFLRRNGLTPLDLG